VTGAGRERKDAGPFSDHGGVEIEIASLNRVALEHMLTGVCQARVQSYVDNPGQITGMVVHNDPVRGLVLVNGRHRTAAARRLNRLVIDVEILEGPADLYRDCREQRCWLDVQPGAARPAWCDRAGCPVGGRR
jgi:hypothetical protein